MKQKSLAKWLKFIIILVGVCGIIVYGGIIPFLGMGIVNEYPEFSFCFLPWLVFLLVTAIPCYIALIFAWKISANIGKDKSFTLDNAKSLKRISELAVIDSIYFFTGNVTFFVFNMNPIPVFGISIILIFFGIAVAVASAVLSHLVNKAAELQNQYDLTV